MHEIEAKILEVDTESVKSTLVGLGAREIQNIRLTVDWYGPKNLSHAGDDPWYLRVRTTSEGKSEVSWKSLPKITGNTRHSDEINFNVSDPQSVEKLLEAMNARGVVDNSHC